MCLIGRTLENIPNSGRRTENCQVGRAVAVIIPGGGNVAAGTELRDCDRAVAAAQIIPNSGRRTENADVGFAVAVIILRRGNIAARAELRDLRLTV